MKKRGILQTRKKKGEIKRRLEKIGEQKKESNRNESWNKML